MSKVIYMQEDMSSRYSDWNGGNKTGVAKRKFSKSWNRYILRTSISGHFDPYYLQQKSNRVSEW